METCHSDMARRWVLTLLKNYLPKEQYDLYLETLPDGDFLHFWTALEQACILFRQTGEKVAEALGFVFPEKEEKGFDSM